MTKANQASNDTYSAEQIRELTKRSKETRIAHEERMKRTLADEPWAPNSFSLRPVGIPLLIMSPMVSAAYYRMSALSHLRAKAGRGFMTESTPESFRELVLMSTREARKCLKDMLSTNLLREMKVSGRTYYQVMSVPTSMVRLADDALYEKEGAVEIFGTHSPFDFIEMIDGSQLVAHLEVSEGRVSVKWTTPRRRKVRVGMLGSVR